jgi:hypothetical protein
VAKDNPAARLLAVVEAMRKVKDGERTENAWARVFELDEPVPASYILQRVGTVLALPQEVRDAVESLLSDNAEHYLRWARPVERAFALGARLDAPWKEVRELLRQPEVNDLKFCELALAPLLTREVVSPKVLGDLHGEILDLLSSVNRVGLDEELRLFLVQHLLAMEAAIAASRFRGTAAIDDAASKMIVHLSARPDLLERLRRSTIWSKARPFLETTLLVINVISGAQELAEGLPELLLGPAPPPEIIDVTPVGDDERRA